MKAHTLPAVVALLSADLLAGCGVGSLGSYAEPGATSAASETEIRTTHSPNDLSPLTAARFIDHVRVGRGVDGLGQVPRKFAAAGFNIGEPIHVSMEVTDAPAGSIVRVAVHDASTDRAAWVQEKPVVPGRSYLNFIVDAKLVPATYRADVIIGDEVVVGKEFQILETNLEAKNDGS